MKRKMLYLLALLALSAFVVACSSGPSAEEIQATADAQVAAAEAEAAAAAEEAAAAQAEADAAAAQAADAEAAAAAAEAEAAESAEGAAAAEAEAEAAAAAQAEAEAAAASAEEAAAMAMAECNVDLSGEEIVIYQQAGREGATASLLGEAFAFATDDALRIINDNGGVCGAEMVIEYCETQYQVEKDLECYEGFRSADPKPVVLLTYGSAATVALKDRVIEDQIINIAAGVNAEAIYVPRDGYTLGAIPIYSDQLAAFGKWASENWADVKPADAGDEVVLGVIGWPGAFGSGATTPEAVAYLESLGVTVLPLEEQPVDPSADISGQIQNLALQGANIIYNQNLSFSATQTIGTVRALGLWDSVMVGGVSWTMNVDVVNFLGETPQAADGYYGIFPHLGWDDVDEPGIQLASEAFAAGGYPEAERSNTYLLTFATFFALHDVYEKAINDSGYDALSGETVLAAMQDMGIVNGAGILELDVRGENRATNRAQVRRMTWNGEKIVFEVVEDFFNLPDTRPAP